MQSALHMNNFDLGNEKFEKPARGHVRVRVRPPARLSPVASHTGPSNSNSSTSTSTNTNINKRQQHP